MATTTVQPSNSLITTSSSAFTTSSTPTAGAGAGAGATGSAGDGNPNSGNVFSLNDSPPLVVAFLAIGLFVVAIIGVFGWRHFSQFRSLDGALQGGATNAANRARRRKSITLGKRPALWDLWVDLSRVILDDRGRLVEQRTEWEHIAPMTTIVTYLVPHAPSPESSLRIKSESAVVVVNSVRRFRVRARFGTQWGRRSASAPLRRLFWPDASSAPPPLQLVAPPHPRHLPSPSSPPLTTSPPPLMISDSKGKEVEGAESQPSGEIGWGDTLSVQVSVIIAMPSQRRLQQVSWSTLGKDTDPEGTRLGEFCIGTMDVPVPWSECG